MVAPHSPPRLHATNRARSCTAYRVTHRPSRHSDCSYGPCCPAWTGASRPPMASHVTGKNSRREPAKVVDAEHHVHRQPRPPVIVPQRVVTRAPQRPPAPSGIRSRTAPWSASIRSSGPPPLTSRRSPPRGSVSDRLIQRAMPRTANPGSPVLVPTDAHGLGASRMSSGLTAEPERPVIAASIVTPRSAASSMSRCPGPSPRGSRSRIARLRSVTSVRSASNCRSPRTRPARPPGAVEVDGDRSREAARLELPPDRASASPAPRDRGRRGRSGRGRATAAPRTPRRSPQWRLRARGRCTRRRRPRRALRHP